MNFQQVLTTPDVKPGVYRHFKGRTYEVVGVAREVDSCENFVVYRPLYGDKKLVIRSQADFMAIVRQNDQEVPRFRYVEPARVRIRRRLRRLMWTFAWRKRLGRGLSLEQVPKAGHQHGYS
jgi:hypothetical protein